MYTKGFLVFQLLILSVIATKDFHCLNNSNDFKCRFNDKTPYRFIANNNDTEINFPGNANNYYLIQLIYKIIDKPVLSRHFSSL